MSRNYRPQTHTRLTNQAVLYIQLPSVHKLSHLKFSLSDMATDTDAEGLTLAPHMQEHLQDYRNKHLIFGTRELHPSSAVTANCKGDYTMATFTDTRNTCNVIITIIYPNVRL